MLVTLNSGGSPADLSAAAATYWTYSPTKAGKLYIKQCRLVYEEAVAAGGFSGTTPVVSMDVEGTEVATHSPDLVAGQALGDAESWTINTTNVTADNGVYEYSADDTIVFKVKTQGAGGTVTGTVRLQLVVDEDRS